MHIIMYTYIRIYIYIHIHIHIYTYTYTYIYTYIHIYTYTHIYIHIHIHIHIYTHIYIYIHNFYSYYTKHVRLPVCPELFALLRSSKCWRRSAPRRMCPPSSTMSRPRRCRPAPVDRGRSGCLFGGRRFPWKIMDIS